MVGAKKYKMHEAKKYLKSFDKITLRKLLKISSLTEIERWVFQYAFIEERLIENTIAKLNISRSTYRNILQNAMTKVHFSLQNMIDSKTEQKD